VIGHSTRRESAHTRSHRVAMQQWRSLSSSCVQRHGRRRCVGAHTTAASTQPQLVHINLVRVVVRVVVVAAPGRRRRLLVQTSDCVGRRLGEVGAGETGTSRVAVHRCARRCRRSLVMLHLPVTHTSHAYSLIKLTRITNKCSHSVNYKRQHQRSHWEYNGILTYTPIDA